ncbi:YciI family protein [Aestuariispira ectoiniformans]|uniref:YciI family protein n=1 Tax=Aestuariispira ectoiniformans TaxID=2775080 RepID=UPI00223BC6FA|nr:YciI family protein [Aestuariispira ectoiniformans]
MAYVIECTDKANAIDIRKANREAHLIYLDSHKDRIIAAGPLLDSTGDGMIGSLLIMDFDNDADVEAFCSNDPYAKAGLFEKVSYRPWKKVYPAG